MKTTTLITSLLILVALALFVVNPVTADDDERPRPPAPPEVGPEDAPHPLPPQGKRPAPGAHHAAMAMHAADANRDGRVSAEEWKAFQGAQSRAFEAADKDGDGALSQDEMPRAPRMRRGPARRGPAAREPGGAGAFGPRQGRRGPDGPDGPPPGGPAGRRAPHGRTTHMGPPPGKSQRGSHGPQGQGQGPARGPRADRGPRGDRGARAARPPEGEQIERLTAALEKLLERLESRPPR